MSLYGRLKAAAGAFLTDNSQDHSGFSFLNRPTTSGVTVNQSSALTLSPYFAGIRNISEDIGKLPTYIFEKLPESVGGKKRVPQHTVDLMFNTEPNTDMIPMDLKQTLTSHALGWGNGVAEIVRNSRGEPIHLLPIHPGRVQILRNQSGQIEYEIFTGFSVAGFRIAQSGLSIKLPQSEVFHIKGLSLDGLYGMNTTQLAADCIGTGVAAQLFTGSFFGNGAWAGGILSHPGVLTPVARENLTASWDARNRGSNKAHKTVVLEEGMKWEQVSVDPRRAQLIELRKFTVTEVARWLRIPPHKIADLERATFANIEEQNIDYITDTLLPWIIRWEQEVSRKLLKKPNLFAKFQTQALLRGDQASRSSYYKTMSSMGVLSVNEIREFEDLNPIGPEGDVHHIPLNMGVLGDTDNEKEGGNDMKVESKPTDVDEDKEDAVVPVNQKFAILISSAVQRVNNKERKAVDRVAKKGQAEWDKFATTFYSGQFTYAYDNLNPILEATCEDSVYEAANELLSIALQSHYNFQRSSKSATISDSCLQDLFNSIISGKSTPNA